MLQKLLQIEETTNQPSQLIFSCQSGNAYTITSGWFTFKVTLVPIKYEENSNCFSVTVGSRVDDRAAPRFNNYDEMMYHDYESQDAGDWSNYSPVSDIYTGDADMPDSGHSGQVYHGLGSGPPYQQRPQTKFGYNALHDNPPSGNPFDDPFFQNFLKGLVK